MATEEVRISGSFTIRSLINSGSLLSFITQGHTLVIKNQVKMYDDQIRDFAKAPAKYTSQEGELLTFGLDFSSNSLFDTKVDRDKYIKSQNLSSYYKVNTYDKKLNRLLKDIVGETNDIVFDHILDYMEQDFPQFHIFSELFVIKRTGYARGVLWVTFTKAIELGFDFLRTSRDFRSSSVFSSAYNISLKEYTYPEVYPKKKASKIKNKSELKAFTDYLRLFRSFFLFIDRRISQLFFENTEGVFKSIMFGNIGIPQEDQRSFTFIDLFAGVGSFRKSFQNAGGKCIWTNDFNPPSLTMYEENFDVSDDEMYRGKIEERRGKYDNCIETPDRLDASKEYMESLVPELQQWQADKPRPKGVFEPKPPIPAKFDVLLAGFPCKSFSGANPKQQAKKFFNDEKYGKLIFHTLDVISCHGPKMYVLENVNGFEPALKLNLEGINDKLTQYKNGPRYKWSYVKTVSHQYSCQERPRLFIVGVREDIAKGSSFNLQNIPFVEKSDDLEVENTLQETALHIPGEKAEPPYTIPWSGVSVPNPRFNCSPKEIERMNAFYDMENGYPYRKRPPEERKPFGKGDGRGYAVFNEEHPTTVPTLTTKTEQWHLVHKSLFNGKTISRRFTPRETCRIMGFDLDRSARIRIPISNAQAFAACGNSIVTGHMTELALYVTHFL
jgi:DNA (cytosine-5)-methyltransferase 1